MNAQNSTRFANHSLVFFNGQTLFDKDDTTSVYQVLSGEVLILRNGQMVDLVQSGELLDAGIWNGVTAVAWTDCVLQPLDVEPQNDFPYTNPAAFHKNLEKLASLLN